MELSLTIDQGNTAVKMALFDGHKLLKSWRMEQLTEESIDLTLRDFPVAKAIYSSVAGCDCRQLTHLQRKLQRLYVLDRKLPMPLTIDYASPDTLGHDRIAAAVGALELIPGRNLLVVDAGTAVTYDFVTADRHFKGGNIAPGLALRLQALARFCARLPQVESNGETPLIGCDTPTAIRSGAVRGIVAEVSYMAKSLKREYGSLSVVLTGGDSRLIVPLLGMADVSVNNDLVAIGLNRILEYNEIL